jgi:hypothetical protein
MLARGVLGNRGVTSNEAKRIMDQEDFDTTAERDPVRALGLLLTAAGAKVRIDPRASVVADETNAVSIETPEERERRKRAERTKAWPITTACVHEYPPGCREGTTRCWLCDEPDALPPRQAGPSRA